MQVIRCGSCGAQNRVDPARVGQGNEPVCGRCQKPLQLSVKPVTVTDATLQSQVENSPLPVLLDLWAPWCGPCRMMTPVLDQLATEVAGRATIAKLNIDENPATAARFKVQSIPTLIIFKDGREVDRIIGAQPKSELLRRLERFWAKAASA